MKISDFLTDEYSTRRWLEKSTIECYVAAVNMLDGWQGRRMKFADLSGDVLRAFIQFYRDTHAPTTLNRRVEILLTLWRHAFRWEFTDNRPVEKWEIPKVPEPERTPEAFTIDEFSRLLRACKLSRRIAKDGVVWDGRHWKALFLTIYDTAERIGALLQTERSQLAASGHLKILGVHRKAKKRDIVRRLHQDTVAAIKTLPKHRLLFPWPLCRRKIYDEVETILEAAGLPVDRYHKFHCGRKTSATQVANKYDVLRAAQHLDHGSVRLTRRVYIDPRQTPGLDVVDDMDRPA